MGNDQEAQRHFELTWQNGQEFCQKNDARSCIKVAVARCESGQCDSQALAYAQKAIKLTPKSPEALEAKAFILMKQDSLF